MLKFEVVDGVVLGSATAVVELSYEIPVRLIFSNC